MAKKPKNRKKGVRTTMPAEHEEKNAANGELREGANVDKIRDILFGSNMREYEKRFARLEGLGEKAFSGGGPTHQRPGGPPLAHPRAIQDPEQPDSEIQGRDGVRPGARSGNV